MTAGSETRVVSEAPYPADQYAILFTDLEGSSVLNGKLGDDVYKQTVLAPLLAIQQKAITQHRGFQEGTPAGDSIMALFAKTDDAIQAALAMLESTKEWNAANRERIGQEVWLRIGIHFSEEVLEWKPDTHLSGYSDCNFAARIMGLACGGQITVSQRAQQRKDNREYAWCEWPYRRLKSFEDSPESVYTVGWAHENAHKEPGTALIPDWLREQNRYIARPELENRIVDCFKKRNDDTRPPSRLVTIHGFGGMGKTRLALRCCVLMLGMFESRVQFVRLDNLPVNSSTTDKDRAELLAGAIAVALGLPPEASTLEALPFSLPHRRMLLVLDNFETVAGQGSGRLIARIVEKNADLTLLVTGRRLVGLIHLEKAFEIVPLNDMQARELLEDRIRMRPNRDTWQPSPIDETAMTDILRLTRGHPLSLVLVAARADKRSLREIADGLQKTALGRETRLSPTATFDSDTSRHDSLELCLEWSWNLLRPSEQNALSCLSLFTAPFRNEDALGCFPEDALETPHGSTVTEDDLEALQEAALLEREERAGGQSFYSLLRPTQEYADKKLRAGSALEACLSGFITYYRHLMERYRQGVYDHESSILAIVDILYADASSALFHAIGREEEAQAVAIYSTLTRYQHQRSLLAVNRFVEENMLAFRRKVLPWGHPDIALSLNNLARLYDNQGRYAEAEPLYKEALRIWRSALPEGHPDIANSLNNLALLYDKQARYEEAEPLYEEALRIRRATLMAGHPDIALSLNNLAALYDNQGRYGEAEPLYKEALRIWRAALPEGHPDIALSLNNLAVCYRTQGRYGEAEPLYKEALRIRRAALPEGHPDIALSLNNLARLYDNQGRYQEAEPLYEEALQIGRAALPAGHPDIALSLNNLAALYDNQGRYGEAEPLYKEALRIWRAALPEGHPHIASSLNNLAMLYSNQGRYEEALPLMKEAWEIIRASLGEENPRTQTVAANYASLLKQAGPSLPGAGQE